MTDSITLEVQRIIRARPERIFEAWTTPQQLCAWWGPSGVTCSDAAVDLREGGQYHLDNTLPDGNVLRILGEFEKIDRPHTLIYSWRLGAATQTRERVTVRFLPHADGTEVKITHERIATTAARDQHEHGWLGCLDGLVELVEAAA